MKINQIIPAAILLSLLAIVYTLNKEEETPVTAAAPTTKPATVSSKPKTNPIKDAYMDGCIDGDDSMNEYCSCTYNYIIDKWGVEGMLKIGETYDGVINLTNEMAETVDACLDEI